jgi:glycosyltransferase involved in cell wall biosynthesis
MAEILIQRGPTSKQANRSSSGGRRPVISGLKVALLTAGEDKPYALGIGPALAAEGIFVDFIGSDEVNGPELHDNPLLNFLNLRGNQRRDASGLEKARRVLRYYARLIRYAATAEPKIFHILWNNKFELFDRTLLMLYYRLMGRRIAFTAHNVNSGKRDSNDTFLNRLSLKTQYSLAHHIFVHTEKMKSELMAQFAVRTEKVTIIPFGINNTLPNTELTRIQARETLGLSGHRKTMLFFGNIAPYKGLEHLIAALAEIARKDENYRLIIAGAVKDCGPYWETIQQAIARAGVRERVIEKIGFIPDAEAELYFKAADVLVLPYNHIFQSGVLFLGYSFGLPVIATDVGSLKEDIIEGKTGFVCQPRNPGELAKAIESYFASDLFRNLEARRGDIRDYANERYSWAKVAEISAKVYSRLLP